MYSTKEAELIYYEENLATKTITKIGNKDDLIYHIAKSADDFFFHFWKSPIDACFKRITEQNITKNDGQLWKENKIYHYFDSKGKTIDIRIFRDDAYKYVKKYGKPYDSSYKRNPKYQHRKRHNGIWYCNNKSSNVMGYVRKFHDEEMKPFLSKEDKESMKGWNKNYWRQCSCNWKDQKKYKKQWMHKAKAKDCNTIRKWNFEA